MRPSDPPSSRPSLGFASRVAFVAAGLVVAALILVSSPWFSDWAARVLEVGASQVLGEDVVIGELAIQPGRARAQLDGVVISHRSDNPDHHGQAIVVVDRLAVELGLRGWRPVARRITIDKPFVHLHLDPGEGLREFRGVKRTDGPRAEALPWQELWLRSGNVRLTAGDLDLRIDQLDITPEARVGRQRLDLGTLQLDVRGWTQRAERVSLPGVLLTPSRIDVPSLDLALQAASLRGSFGMVFGGALRGDVQVEARLAELKGLLPDHLRLEGVASVDAELRGDVGDPKIEGAVLVEDGAVWRRRDDGEVLLVQLKALAAALRFADSRVVLDPAQTDWAGGHVEARASFDLETRSLRASASGEGLSLAGIFERTGVSDAPWVDLRTDAEVQLTGTLKPLFLAGTAWVAGRNLRVASGPVDRTDLILGLSRVAARAEVRVLDQYLFLGVHDIQTAGSRGRATAELDLGTDRSMVLDLDLYDVLLDEMRPVGGLQSQGRLALKGRLSGPMTDLSLVGQVRSTDFGVLGYRMASELESPLSMPTLQLLRLTDLSGRLGDSTLRGRVEVELGGDPTALDLQLLLRDGRIADLIGIVAEAEGIDGDVEGTLSLSGPAEALDGEVLLELGAVDLFGERFEVGRADARLVGGRVTVDRVEVRRGEDGALLRGSIEPDGAINLDVHTSDLSLSQLDRLKDAGVDLDGELALHAKVGGSLSMPEPTGTLSLRRATLAGRVIGDSSVEFDTTGDTLGFAGTLGGPELDVAGTVQLGGEGAWAVQADLAQFPAHVFYPVTPDGTPLDARITGTVVAAGELGVEGQPFQLTATTEEVSLDWASHRLRSRGPWALAWSDEAFSVSGVELEGGATRVVFSGARSADSPLRLDGEGVLDLDLLRAVVPGLERSQGRVRVDVAVVGERGALEPSVRARIEDGRFHATWLPEPIEGASATLTGVEDGYTVEGLTARMGGGALTGRGAIEAVGWVPRRYDLHADLVGTRVRYFDWLPPVAGDAKLTFTGPASEPLMKGRITVKDMLFAERIDWEDAVVDLAGERLVGATAEETDDLFAMDIAMVSDRSIRVRNNLGDLVASGELRLVGDTARPGLVGSIRAQPGGRVYLKEREFELLRGELHFVEPYAFDPELDIALATEVRTSEDEYAIDYRVSGPWSDWRADSRSDPALPEADINALLLFGMTLAEMERYGSAFSALALEGGDLLASKFGLVETLGQGIYGIEQLRPDRIDLVSGVTERGSGTISSELRILAEKDVDWATVIFEQNLSRLNDRYVALERRLANRLYLRGFWAQQQVGRNLTIGGAWGMDFNLRWEVD